MSKKINLNEQQFLYQPISALLSEFYQPLLASTQKPQLMSSFLQNYCDVTESLAFKSSQIHSSSSSEQINHPHPKPNKLKCFNCFGNDNKTEYCAQCGGTAYITDSHPLAMLFNDILCQKLDAMPITNAIWTDYDQVRTIKEQAEDLDQMRIVCNLCKLQCDMNYKYYCQCCQCFFVCVKCAEQKGDDINHPHPLATNKLVATPNLILKRTDSTNIASNKNSPTKQQTQDYLNINDIISQDFRVEFQKLVKTHMSDLNQFEDFDVGDSVIIRKPFSLERQSITVNQDGAKGLFGEINKERREHYWKVNKEGELVRGQPVQPIQPQPSNLSMFFDTLNPTNSRIMGDSSIQVRQSIDFNLFDTDPMGVSTGPRQSFGLNRQSLSYNRQSISFGRQSIVLQLCNHCSTELKDFYSICRTCERQKINFKFCCQCEDKKKHNHDKSHEIQSMLGNVLGRMEDMVSESAIESQDEDQFGSMRMTKKKSSLQKRPPRLPQSPSFDDDLSWQKSFCKLKCAQSFEMNSFDENNNRKTQIKVKNFGQQSIINLDFDGLYNSRQLDMSKQLNNIKLLHKKSSLLDVNNSIQNLHGPNLSRFNQKKQQKPRVCFVQDLLHKNKDDDDEEIPIQYVESDSDSKEEEQQQCNTPVFIDVRKALSRTVNRTSYRSIKSFKHLQHTRKQQKALITSSSRQITSSISYSRSSIRTSQRQYHSNISQLQQKRSLLPIPSSSYQQQQQQQQFIFHQYSCDQCGCRPIKNVRYHCLECQDYDLCESCFDSDIEVKHAHDFEKIDGLKKIKEQRALLLQRKDLNKGRESLIRNSNQNIGMLAKTKRTVQMVKKGVNQLNNSIMNVTRSFGSYGQFLGQRMSLRQKVQS